MDSPLKILVIEDAVADFRLLERHLRQQNLVDACRRVASDAELEEALREDWDLVLSDYSVPGMEFHATLQRILAVKPELPVILVSGSVGEETAVELLHQGVADFVLKDNLIRLPSVIRRSIVEVAERRARVAAETALRASQATALEEQRQARLAALNLMEDALAARLRAEAANAALQESEAKYRLLADNAVDCIFWIGPDGRYRYVSPACFQISGHAPEEFVADPGLMSRIIHPDDRPAYAAHIVDMDGADAGDLEYRVVRADGAVRWINHHCMPVYDAAGTFLGRRGANRDITKRKQAEGELRKLSLAVEQSPESIVITDVAAKIEYVNDAFLRATGYRPDEVIGQNPRILKSGRTPPENYRALWDALSQGRTWQGEMHNRRKDGSEYVEFAIITPIRQPDGRITHYVAVKEDITEKKRTGAELDRHRHHLEELVAERTAQLTEARDQAETATRAKSAFLANMSHEIRTPMNAIVGLTHLLKRAEPTAEQAERLDKIETAAGHLLSIINDILDLSKIEAGKVVLEETDFQLSAILDQVRALIAESAHAKGLGIEVDYGDVPVWLRGDPTRLRQALLNYAGNAVKFTERGTVSLRAQLLEERGDELLVRFAVQDTGIGIAADQLARLFRAFEQADASTTRKYGGTGLGLAVTQRLAALMGGGAGAESAAGVGSTFWITARLRRGQGRPAMPAAVAADAKHAEAALRREHAGAHVLLAEDDPINQEVALAMLCDIGLAVNVAADGRQAVAKAAATPYDLILMDMQMPEMDGIAATRAIRALPEGRDVPILAMTANAFAEDRAHCLAAGMDDFIAKPVSPDELYKVILRWLARRAPGLAAAPPRAPPAADTALRRRLAAIEGLDPERVLANLRGNIEKYWQLLLQFAANHRDDPARLAAHVAQGDPDAALQVAHMLKGTAATLGLTQLQGTAAALEAALHSGRGDTDLSPLLGAVALEMAALERALATPPAIAAAPVAADAGRARQVLQDLETLLAAGDFGAGRLFRNGLALLRACLDPDTMSRLEREVNAYDFPAALNTVRTAHADLAEH